MAIGIGLQALGAGWQGGDPGTVVKRYQDALDSQARKERVATLLERMNIAGPQRAILEAMPFEQVPGLLWQMQQQEAARRAAGGAAAAKAAEERAAMEAFMSYAPQSQTRQTARLGPTVEAAQAGARSGSDLAAMQTEVTPARISPEMVQRAMFDPRLSDAGRKRILEAYEFQQKADGGDENFRMASPEEAALYGAVAGQFGPDDRFYPINPPTGLAIESDGQGGFRLAQGAGVSNSVAGWGTRASGEIEKRKLDAGSQLARLTDTRALFKPEYQEIPTQAGFAWDSWTAKMGADLPPERQAALADYTRFRVQAFNNLNTTLKEISGAAVNESEMPRLTQQLPSPGQGIGDGDDPVSFKAKMDESILLQRMAIARYNLWQAQGGIGKPWDLGPLDDVREMINKRGKEIEEALRQEGYTDKAVIEEETRKRLQQEVWGY